MMNATKKFQRTIEDFVCEHCGVFVVGNGYTNHCPVCLWSKHVDVHPGDRSHTCEGLMKPVHVEGASPSYTLVHRCVHCAYEKRNVVGEADSTESIIALAQKTSE
jgi:hypothetical protein